MPKKRNPYLSPQDIASLLSPPPQESLPLPPTTPTQLPQTSISTALSNTLVIDLIFGNLSEADIRTCLKVCTAWNNLAQPHFWKSIAHYYTRQYYDYDDCSYCYYDPISNPTFRWWEKVRDPWCLDTFGRDIDSSIVQSHSSSVSSSSRSKASTLIHAKQRELICRNAFRVKSLRIDYSASNLLDVPFMNLIRLSLSCRHSHTVKTASWNFKIAGGLEDQRLKGVALELIARNPRLKELELSYVEEQNGWYGNSTRVPQMSFAIRVLQVLQRHQLSLSSSPSINNNNNNRNNDSGLSSLKLTWTGDPTLNDICTIFENCPPSLKELTIHTHKGLYSNLSTPDPQVIQKRFADLKNNNYPITANNSPYRQRTPNLRLLNVAQHKANRACELETRDPETTFFPMLACFPDIQDLFLPNLSYEWTINRCAELITILTTSCLALTSINFGENFIEEEHMFCFLMALPEGQLRGITMKIRPNFLTRVVPTLLERSRPASVAAAGTTASTLEVIYLYERGFERHHSQQRSKYILEFLASCPCLKTLVTVPASRRGSHAYTTSSYFELQLSDLMQKEWICSKLETLSIGILKLTVAIYSPSEYQGLDESNMEEEDTTLQKITAPDDAELSKYRRKVQALTSFYFRLKNSLPYLKTLDLRWSESHNNVIPFDCAVEYSKGVLTIARLRWMGLSWWTIHGLETATVQEAYRGLSERERNMFSRKKMQEKGITVYRQESGCQRCQRGAWGSYGCVDANELDWRWYENTMNWDEPVFEDLADAYKSRSIRRLHEETKRRK